MSLRAEEDKNYISESMLAGEVCDLLPLEELEDVYNYYICGPSSTPTYTWYIINALNNTYLYIII